MQTLKNKFLAISVDKAGAELTSIVNQNNGHEYLWQADPKYWKRHSPVLFPIVGTLWNGEFSYKGDTFQMAQHGFARDMDFTLFEETDSCLNYILKSNAETLSRYPFSFELEIGYELIENKIKVKWRVRNTDNKTIYFQIGAHPAFYYPDFDADSDLKGYFSFNNKENLEYIIIREEGCVDPTITHKLNVDKEGDLSIDAHTFDNDALIIEKNQVNSVALLTKEKKPYLALHFDAPLVGLWAPKDSSCPFVCIEPWYGRCDRVGYEDDITGRDYMNSLAVGDVFEASYVIEIAVG